ncbi:MAG TPA: helix-turn-helix transcriptional regulator [Candidatus Angelobacter sp.]
MLSAGKKLRELREQIGLTLRDVEIASTHLAEARGIEEFTINPSRLSDIETKGVVPSIYRLYVLSVIYRADFAELLKLYGVDLGTTAADFAVCRPAKTHRLEIMSDRGSVNMPVKMDPGFDLRNSANLGRMIEDWGVVPLQYLQELAKRKYTYAYIGTEDLTMYPLILPGSFVQIDEERNRIEEGKWHSEFERPIYFIETREGYLCCWCSVRRGEIVLQPHPLSPVIPRILKHPQEAEVIGRVVGLAMQLGGGHSHEQQQRQASPELVEGEPKEVRRR